jgi:outer membrane protein TolC
MRRTLGICAMLVALTGTAVHADDGRVELSLKEAIRRAVEKNLDVQAELYNPAQAIADIGRFRGIYNPELSLFTDYQDSTNLLPNAFTSGVGISRTRSTAFNAGVNQLLSTGATVGAAFINSWNHNNFAGATTLNNYFQSDVTLSLDQPLLKNFGSETTEINISIAKFGKDSAREQFRAKLLDVVSQVMTQYYNLYYLRENLEVKKTSVKLAETILNNTKLQVQAGVLPAMEILNAEFGLATQQKGVIDAERALRDQVDALRYLLQMPAVTEIIPVDTPFRDQYQADESQLVKKALELRPELLQQRVVLQSNELQARVAKNQVMPELNLTASAAFGGLAPTYRRDLERLVSGKYPVWTIGLQVNYPIGNDAAENDYIKSRLKVDQSRVQIKSLEEAIATDVRTSVRAVASGYLQMEVTARGRAYADEVLQAYIKRQKVGLATTKDVLDVLNNQVTARGNEIQALSDYNKSLAQLWKTTGELFEREGIMVREQEMDALYDKAMHN